RAKRTEAAFLERRQSRFVLAHADHLDGGLREDLDHFCSRIMESSVSDWLDGYLRQLEPRARYTLLATLECLGPLGKCRRGALVRRLAEITGTREATAKRLFENMWRQVRERQIALPTRSVSLLELRHSYYRERLTAVASVLRGTLGQSGYKRWRSEWL